MTIFVDVAVSVYDGGIIHILIRSLPQGIIRVLALKDPERILSQPLNGGYRTKTPVP